MKRRFLIFLALLVLAGVTALLIGAARMRPARDKTKTAVTQERAQERIGVYDSRAIAVAYAGSSFQTEKMKGLTAQLAKARAAVDAKEMARLEAEGRAWQASLKNQGFGTAPVENLLTLIEGDLPAIRESAGVTSLISKWNEAELDQHPKAIRVDVTMRLVDAFHPSEKQRQWAIEVQSRKPQN